MPSDLMKSWNETEIERLRRDAAHQDRLAEAARSEGDTWDEAACRAKATELRRAARRIEVHHAE